LQTDLGQNQIQPFAGATVISRLPSSPSSSAPLLPPLRFDAPRFGFAAAPSVSDFLSMD
jgi:hypothetical protein